MAFRYPVTLPDGSIYNITELLGNGDSNAKLGKSEKLGLPILTYGLSLAPAFTSGFNLCPKASAGCIASCLYKSGQANIFPRTILPPRIAKSILLRKHKDVFVERLYKELRSAERRSSKLGAKLFIRLNVYSDVQWEKEVPTLFDDFKSINFYDYTKVQTRMGRFIKGNFPSNYHLTFSRSELNWDFCRTVLDNGFNVAVPMFVKYSSRSKQPLPQTFEGYRVVDGDVSDLRPLDDRGVVVGLRVKGPGKSDKTGFVQIPHFNAEGVGVSA